MKISIIIPCYNSEKNLRKVVEDTIRYLDELHDYTYEFMLVNDYSTDRTTEVIRDLARDYPFVKGLILAKNGGQHNALLAGLHNAEADLYIGMDDDGQTHPSQIKALLDRLNEGYDVVYGRYPQKKEALWRRLGSRINNYTVSKLIGRPKELKISSFWVCRRFVRDEVIKYNSTFTNLQGIFLRITSRITNVEIQHFERASGSSGYTLKKLLQIYGSVLNFSMIPVRLPMYAAEVFFAVFLIHLILYLLNTGAWEARLHVIILVIEACTCAVLLCLSFVAEYLGRLFMVSVNNPQFVVRERINCESSEY